MNKNAHQSHGTKEGGITRRGFLTTMGFGAMAVAISGPLSAATRPGPEEKIIAAADVVPVTLKVNGSKHRILVEPRWTLLYVLRERFGMTGTKEGCARGECGACTVLMDDVPRYACLTLALEAEGASITTVEGLLDGEKLGSVQQAFLENDAYQCGYCTPGQIMAVEGLLRALPEPSPHDIQRGVSGNLCRCGAYPNIFKAAQHAASRNTKTSGGGS